METITDEALVQRIGARAPLWCQDIIYSLDHQLAEARKKIAELSTGPADSNVRVHNYDVTPDRLIGRDTPVSFDIPGGTVTVRHGEGGVLELYCTGPGARHYPHITPGTANTFRVRLGEH